MCLPQSGQKESLWQLFCSEEQKSKINEYKKKQELCLVNHDMLPSGKTSEIIKNLSLRREHILCLKEKYLLRIRYML